MRRSGIALLAALTLIAWVTPAAAQPTVTITGFVDHVSSWTNNLSSSDLNLARTGDRDWYARTRVRPDIIAEVGTTRFVLGLELDEVWGQTGNVGAVGNCGGTATGAAGTQCSFPQRFLETASFALNTDTQGALEIKWAYTEFDLPLVPIPSRLRLGAQPMDILYKGGTLASGDFAGAHLMSRWTPMLASSLTFMQSEESSTGPRDAFVRGDDIVLFASVEVTPFQGLGLRGVVSYANLIGPTSAATRFARGGLGTGATTFPTGAGRGSAIEDRYTVGVDARWWFGPIYVDPTLLYQFGSRDQVSPIVSISSGPAVMTTLQRDAWYVDVRGGWRAGALLIELAGIYTSGNTAGERIDLNRSRLKFFEPISTDNTFFSGWTEMQASGVDYLSRLRANGGGVHSANAIGYDKYGLLIAGTRVSYALSPLLTLRAMAHARWTAESVDTASTLAADTGLTPRCAPALLDASRCADRGTASFYGAEFNLGVTWRVANVTFDLVGSYFVAGPVLSSPAITNTATGVVANGRHPGDAQMISSRVRFSF